MRNIVFYVGTHKKCFGELSLELLLKLQDLLSILIIILA